MKKLVMKLGMVAGLAVVCGCANTRLRMSVADLDFRKPDQILAGQYEAGVIYEAGTPNATAAKGEAKALPVDFYSQLFAMISKLEARLRLFSFESCPVPVAAAAQCGDAVK